MTDLEDSKTVWGQATGTEKKLNWNEDTWNIFDTEIDGLVQERHNSIANPLELRLSSTNP